MENDSFDYKDYLQKLEDKVIIPGINEGILCKKRKVPAKRGRLYSSEFAKFVEPFFEYSEAAAIDYYGFFKKSDGFTKLIDSYEDIEIKSIKIPVAHFASIKIEQISEMANDLVVDFSTFKKYLVSLRGFDRK
jgi:hypothetical protein